MSKQRVIRCFTCGKPGATFYNRKWMVIAGIMVKFCKPDFQLAMQDLSEALAKHPTITKLFQVVEDMKGDSAERNA